MAAPSRRSRAPRAALATFAAFVALLTLAGCDAAGPLAERVLPATAHERYARSLEDAGLHETALGAAWLAAADGALRAATPATLPFREAGYFAGDEARAVAWTVRLERGQRLEAVVAREGEGAGLLFADLFELPEDTLAAPRRVASADSALAPLEVTARRAAVYVLRVQPELLRPMRYDVTLRAGPSLAVFPVEGRTTRAVRSRFGVDRDGGRRVHHGIDIFAPRGTPAVAAVDGFVRSTRPNRLGGRVVWLRDEGAAQSLYYAHLDTVLVTEGQRVRAGDTLGLVGNSGNAVTTPPHLHFGIYARGPADPWPFVHVPPQEPAAVTAALDALGADRRTRAATTLRAHPAADDGARLDAGTPLRVVGAASGSYRVLLADGRAGWVAARGTEALETPLRQTRLADGGTLRDRPAAAAVAMDTVPAGSTLPVLGRLGDYTLVRRGDVVGWVGER